MVAATLMTGAMSESGGDDFYYDDTADFTPDASGNWDAAGGSTQYSGDDAAYFQYAGSARLLRSRLRREPFRLDAGKRLRKHLGQLQRLVLLRHRQLRQHRISSQTADGYTTDTGNDNFSYAASGSYSYSANGGTMSGTASESGGASDSYDFGESISGNWDSDYAQREAKAAATTPTAATPAAAEPTARKSVPATVGSGAAATPSTAVREAAACRKAATTTHEFRGHNTKLLTE